MKLDFYKILVLILLASCSANKINVHMETFDQSGAPLKETEVKILEIDRCCAGDGIPGNSCSFLTNKKGVLDFTFVTGRAYQDGPTRKKECKVAISKSGFQTIFEKFEYCSTGACAGEQFLKLKYKLSPLKD